MRKQRGFTLIELLIVLAIILVIAGLAIPSLVHIKINAHETSVVASLKAIQTAQAAYAANYPAIGYAASLGVLGGSDSCAPSPARACLLDEVITSGSKDGYSFVVIANTAADGTNASYIAGAAPLNYNHTGVHRFCTTEKNVIRSDLNTEGSTTPPTLEECLRFSVMR